MPRPTDKSTLLELGAANYDKLLSLIEALGEEGRQAEFQLETRDRNVRDTMAHLHTWHRMFLEWYRVGMAGEKPEMPAPGFKWKDLPALNRGIWERCQDTSLEDAMAQCAGSFEEVRQLIASHTDEELFTKKRYAWTGSTSLGAYCVSATSSHYDWALKQLRKHQRTMKATG